MHSGGDSETLENMIFDLKLYTVVHFEFWCTLVSKLIFLPEIHFACEQTTKREIDFD